MMMRSFFRDWDSETTFSLEKHFLLMMMTQVQAEEEDDSCRYEWDLICIRSVHCVLPSNSKQDVWQHTIFCWDEQQVAGWKHEMREKRIQIHKTVQNECRRQTTIEDLRIFYCCYSLSCGNWETNCWRQQQQLGWYCQQHAWNPWTTEI